MNNETVSPPLTPAPKSSSRIFKVLFRIFIFLLVSFVLVIGAAFVIVYYYQDEVKEYVVGELNKELNTQIIIDGKDIDFTVLKNFPYASVDFKNVKALEAVEKKTKDTLFSAGRISLQFNVVDVFKKKYDIKKIQIDNANFKIRIDKNGNDNYHILKPTSDTANTSFSFALKKVVLHKIQISYKNAKTNQVADVLVDNSTFSGKFSNENYVLVTQTTLLVNELKSNKTVYLHKKNIVADLALDVDNAAHTFKLKTGKIEIEHLLFELAGFIVNTENESVVNLTVKGKDMDIKSVLSLIPNEYKDKIAEYKSSGEFYFTATLQGAFSKRDIPKIKADFGINNADITHEKNKIALRQVNLKGRYYSGDKATSEPSFLELTSFSATIDQGIISGELSLRDLNQPFVSAKVKATLSLEKIQDFIKLDAIEHIAGQVSMDMSFSGTVKEFQENNYQNILADGTLKVADVAFKLKNNTLDFANINGDFVFNNNQLELNTFTGNVSKTDFDLKGVLKNSIGFILRENEDVTVEATLHSKNVDLNELLANKEEDALSKSIYKLKFSEHINAKLNSTIDHIGFRKFEATNIKGLVQLKDKKMSVDTVVFSSMSGKVTVGGLIDGSDSTHFLITCFSDISNINVTKLFTSFENFDQTVIIDKNIKGVISAKVQFASVFSPTLDIDLDKLYAGIDMTIEKGELNKLESLKKLSRFIELTELENIRFDVLKNQLEIKNKIIYIPKMDIRSNALNFLASGTHTFDNEINYKIKLALNDLLAKKIRKPKKEEEPFGEVADDGLGRTNIFLSMTGPIDNPVIKYDTKSAVEKVKQDLKVEKQTLKKILKDEFGLFKKDSSLSNTTKAKKEDDTKFIIKWEEADVKENKKELKKPKKEIEDDF